MFECLFYQSLGQMETVFYLSEVVCATLKNQDFLESIIPMIREKVIESITPRILKLVDDSIKPHLTDYF
jgi:hypothetical protein